MSAWSKLLAASSLALGTTWQLISSPRTGGTGVVVNNGATAVITDSPVTVALADASMAVAISTAPVALAIADNRAVVAISPGITVQITTQTIGATA